MARMTSLRNSWLVGQRDCGKDRGSRRRRLLPTLYGIRSVQPKAHPDFHPHPLSNDFIAEDGR
ncbi:hypothetical protein ALC53_12918 [Atta colombica]|uniref:Uncharacterized protein n=1 Tax=Atta colombica TaxID=520822 RepID=A0A151HYM9_9HYME|nr:hypothetical protein ALC53_12918 [Atta colombica]